MITTLSFDFSGVLTTKTFFPSLAERWSRQSGLPTETIRAGLDQDHAYMLGHETSEQYWNHALKPLGIPYEVFLEGFTTWYHSVKNDELFSLLQPLKGQYRLVIHSDNYLGSTEAMRRDPAITALFDRCYFSNEIGLAKADPAAFRSVVNDFGGPPEAWTFTDDRPEHAEIANSIGMHGIPFVSNDQLVADLRRLGVTL